MNSIMLLSPRQLPDEEFPPLLKEMPDAPKSLRICGTIPRAHYFLTVVGSRKYSPYGKRSCEALIEGLRGYPIAIVSGLALGIDAIAHESALRAGLPTIAVLPSGLNDSVLYPSSNRALAARIAEAGGGLLSENEDDARPQAWSFAQRNRIMAGMAHATLIVEAGEKSGTLITARLAMEYNRDVLIVPHPIGLESGAGGNALLRQGATLVRYAEDILEALGIDANVKSHEMPQGLTDAEELLYTLLVEPLERDEIMARAEISATDANIALSKLLLKGLIVERMGKIERA